MCIFKLVKDKKIINIMDADRVRSYLQVACAGLGFDIGEVWWMSNENGTSTVAAIGKLNLFTCDVYIFYYCNKITSHAHTLFCIIFINMSRRQPWS